MGEPAKMDYAQVTDYLFSLRGRGVKFGIERMCRFVEELGHPEASFPVIHVAGTNGKGSVCAMLESIYRTAGYKTGLFASPHLVRLGERVQVNRQILPEEHIIAITAELRAVADRIARENPEEHPTFFELITAMAFLRFQREKVDLAFLEVGLGGRLDATNVVIPELSIITSIGLDHCEQLGHTEGEIAREKAGIIKEGRPVVLGRMADEARSVIQSIAAERNAPVVSVQERWQDPGDLPHTGMEGEHQRWNAALATLASEVLQPRFPVSAEAIGRGLTSVEWAGRWQRLELSGKHLILDAAHNPQGAEALDAQLKKLVAETGHRPVVALGALGERRARTLVEIAARHARELHLFVPAQPRATPFEVLEKMIPPGFGGKVVRATVETAFGTEDCRIGNPGDTVVITGSIYLIGETLQRLQLSPRPAETLLQG